MKTLQRFGWWTTVVVLVVASASFATEQSTPTEEVTAAVGPAAEVRQPVVQMAILLDTSGSMSGLIDQARTELWSIVNEFIFARRNGVTPQVEVALYEYGKSLLPSEEGYLRQIVPLTTDLDKISEELFALTTNGGSEHCGWVIKEATEGLQWSASDDDLKVIFIAGNEPFTQGPVPYQAACQAAVTRGILVNTIHCGSERQGVEGKWKDGAAIADGRYLNIDHNRQVVHIPAPQDAEIAALGVRLNETYIPFGLEGAAARERQSKQDSNARQVSAEAVVQRAVTKSSGNYVNTGWDLVDAVQAGQADLDEIAKSVLPENMQNMSAAERKAYVEKQAQERAEVQAKIQTLNEQRRAFLAEPMKQQQAQGQTLGSAVQQAIRAQAEKKNYTFEAPESPAQSAGESSEKKTD